MELPWKKLLEGNHRARLTTSLIRRVKGYRSGTMYPSIYEAMSSQPA